MGGMVFPPESLGDSLAETAGYKAGLALSIEAMCDHLNDTDYAELILSSETQIVRIRSEEYEDLFYKLLHRIGYTEEEYDGDIFGINLYHKYRETDLEEVHEGVLQIFNEAWPKIIEQAIVQDSKMLDPTTIFKAAEHKYGMDGIKIVMEKIEAINKGLQLNPSSQLRYTEWRNIEKLESLFKGGSNDPEFGRFIDQRFINYLYANNDKLPEIHWRKFEELTAEFFDRDGYKVELGPGQNDDGVDVRIWKDDQNQAVDPPHCIIQCKRQKKKIEKVVIKGLFTDVEFQGADHGLIVTTSELSPGARKTIAIRCYPIQEVNYEELRRWLKILRVPGTGIVRV